MGRKRGSRSGDAGLGMIDDILARFGLGRLGNRRKYRRYPVSAPVEVLVGGASGTRYQTEIANVSAGGAMLTPSVPCASGDAIRIFHPASTMSVDATVVSVAEDETRVRFASEGAGSVVSVWLRGLHGKAEA